MKAVILTISFFAFLGISYADVPSAGDFSVYAIQDIGTAGNPYTSDFQGIAGAGGGVYVDNFALNTVGGHPAPASGPVSLFAGQNFSLTNGQINNGGVEVGGNITISGVTIGGNVNGGGNLTGSNSTINGNVTLSGAYNAPPPSGSLTQNTGTYTPTLNLLQTSAFFKNAAAAYASLAPSPNLTVTNNNFGTLTVSGLQSGLNMVQMSFGTEASLFNLVFNGIIPNDAIVVFDITGTGSTLKGLNVSGLPLNDILFNIDSTGAFSMGSSATYASVLAPNSNITFTNGQLDGNLIAGNLYGSGQVDIGPGLFNGWNTVPTSSPEPSTYLLLASFLGALLGRRLRHSSQDDVIAL